MRLKIRLIELISVNYALLGLVRTLFTVYTPYSMVQHSGARKNITQLAKYPSMLYDKPSNWGFFIPLFFLLYSILILV